MIVFISLDILKIKDAKIYHISDYDIIFLAIKISLKKDIVIFSNLKSEIGAK